MNVFYVYTFPVELHDEPLCAMPSYNFFRGFGYNRDGRRIVCVESPLILREGTELFTIDKWEDKTAVLFPDTVYVEAPVVDHDETIDDIPF